MAEASPRLSGGGSALLFRTLAAASRKWPVLARQSRLRNRALNLANRPGKLGLANELQGNIALYQAQRPLRDPSLTNGSSSP
jgi:hypothetical protein